MKGVFRDHNSQTLEVKTESVKKTATIGRHSVSVFEKNDTLTRPSAVFHRSNGRVRVQQIGTPPNVFTQRLLVYWLLFYYTVFISLW
jgi:hypothetical protein